MLVIVDALDHRAEQSWTSRQVLSLNEMNRVAGDALENHRRNLLSEANAELNNIYGEVMDTFKYISNKLRAIYQKYKKMKFEFSRLRIEKIVKI